MHEPLELPDFKLSEHEKAIQWVIDNYPYEVLPSENPGQGEDIFEWLRLNVGEMDIDWTYLNRSVRFRNESDYAFYILTWQR